MISMCCLSSSMVTPSFLASSGIWWFCSSRRCSVTIFSVGVPSRPMCRSCSVRHSCRSRAQTPIGSKPCSSLQRAFDLLDRPRAHARDLVHRCHQVAVVVEVADDGLADLAHQLVVVGLDRELPAEMIGERAAGRERVLDRRQLFDFLRRARPVAVVEVLAEEILVVLVVPGVVFLLGGASSFSAACGSAACRSSVGTSSSSGFSTTSWLSRSASSSVDIGSSLIACCSDGVRISFCASLVCSFC